MTPTSIQPIGLLWVGLLLGLRHAADSDHVVAVGAIAARTRRLWPAAQLGIVWGLGHTVTLFAVASGIIVFDWVVPPRVGLAMELCVAVALILIGLLNVRAHSHEPASFADASGPRRAFLVGLVHGLAGSAAVALLVVASVRDPRWACLYLLVFGAGTLSGMTLITIGLAWPMATLARRGRLGDRLIRAATGGVSLAMGVWLVYQIAWVDGLVRAVPNWTPH